uniref:Uncharacterized protein n=1 Tax=Oryza glumipatula TaxID=40148 RepID=A0A0D9Y7S2_9ORYZ
MLLAFAWAFDAQQVFMSVFTDAEPPWHCTGVVDAVAAAAGDSGSSCSSPAASASPCVLPPGTWEWDRPAETSVALNCGGGGPALVSLPASSFFTGNLVVVLPYSLICAPMCDRGCESRMCPCVGPVSAEEHQCALVLVHTQHSGWCKPKSQWTADVRSVCTHMCVHKPRV